MDIKEALTFDDVLLQPAASGILPAEAEESDTYLNFSTSTGTSPRSVEPAGKR